MRRVSRSQIAMLAVIGTGVVLLFPSLLAGFSQGQSAVETQIELTKIAVEVVKVIGLGAGAYFALYKWRRDERWKRRSMVSDRIKAFRDTPGAYNAQLMLQGRRVKVPLWDRTVSEDPYTMVHPDEVAAALMAVTPGHTWRYSDRHDAIRNSFNDYLGRLADIAMDLSHTSLLNEADVRLLRDRTRRTFLQLCDTNPNTAKALWEYMESGGYQDVAAFIDPPEPSTLQYIKGYLSRSTPEPSGEIKRRYTENLQKPPRNEPTALPGERKGNAEQP